MNLPSLECVGTLSKFITLFVIATIPIPFAAVQPWIWSFYCLMMIIAFVTDLWTGQPTIHGSSNLPKYAAAIFFIWALILCVPMSPSLLSVLSPIRVKTLTETWEFTHTAPSWQAISYLSNDALAWWAFLASLGLFYLVVRRQCYEGKTLKRIVILMIFIGLGEAIYGLIQALVPSMGVLWVDYVRDYLGSARGTFINRNNFAGFIEMIWPVALGLTLSTAGQVHSIKMVLHSDRLNRQALMALCIIVFLLTLILTRSRAGIICGLLGFLVFFTLARPGMQRRSSQIRIMLAGIVALLTIYIMVIGIGPVIERFFFISSDGGSRIGIWRDSLRILLDHPWGIGLHNYENVIEVYNHAGTSEKMIGYAHNDYLQLLIETGWVGFLALAGAFLFFTVDCLRRLKTLNVRKDPLRFFLAVGAFSGIASIGVHCFFDFNLQIPANCVYFVVLMAILSACTHPEKSQETPT